MRRYRIVKDRGKLHRAVWIAAGFVFACLLIRIITLSFSKEIGQAKNSFSTMLMTKLCINVMESGSSLISYEVSEDVEAFSLPVSILADHMVLNKYTKNNESLQTLIQNNKIQGLPLAYPETQMGTYASNETENGKITFHDITEGKLSREYILTNGAAFDEKSFEKYIVSGGVPQFNASGQLSVGVMDGDYTEGENNEYNPNGEGSAIEAIGSGVRIKYTMEQLKNVNFLVRNFYIVDQDTRVTEELFDTEAMLAKDMTMKQENDAPQILIYHTHSQEAFVDSRENEVEDTVVGIGTYLTEILEDRYGYNVIHDTSNYDLINGVLDRNKAYNYAEDGIMKILEENPTIEVVIDLHRDGMPKRSTLIDGKETARVMLFNGLSRDQDGPIDHLYNPYLQDNLAFSLKLQLEGNEKYPGLFYGNYLKSYRYNLHVRPKSILIELGTYKNTVESARNAMEPFAEVLDAVLQGEVD